MAEKIKLNFEVDGLKEANKEMDNLGGSTKNLRTQLREATNEAQELAAAEIVDQEALNKAVQKAAELRDRIADTNEQINIFASGSKYEVVSNAFGNIGSSIRNLDFEKAQDRALAFAKAASAITFGDAIKSVKQLGSTFLQVGKALLTNPLFLIAAVVIGIVMAIKKLLEETGLLKVIMEAVGKVFEWIMIPINALIDGLKRLTDWFGWTSHAAEEAADKQVAAAEKAAAAQEKQTEGTIQGLNTQIRLAKLAGEDTSKLERQKLQEIQKTAVARAAADKARFDAEKKKGDLTVEEIAQLEEVSRKSRLALKQASDDIKVFEAEVVKARKDANDAKKASDDKAEADRISSEKASAKERADNYKQFLANRLAAERQQEDLRIQLMDNDFERELELNRVKYERMRQDTLSATNLTSEEKQNLIDFYNQIEISKNKEMVDKKAADEKVIQDKIDADKDTQFQKEIEAQATGQRMLLDKKIAGMEEGFLKEKELEQIQFQDELDNLSEMRANGLLADAEYFDLVEAATQEHKDRLKEIDDEELARTEEFNQLKRDMALQATMGLLSGINDIVQAFAGESEEAQKKAFKVNQAFQIAQATIDTIKGGVSAFTGMVSQIPGPAGIALGAVAAAGVVASGMASIKKIASTKFQGAGAAASPSIPQPSASTPTGTPPSINLFGQANEGSEGGGNQQSGLRQQSMVRAVVVESDITNTQNRLSTYQQRSEIG